MDSRAGRKGTSRRLLPPHQGNLETSLWISWRSTPAPGKLGNFVQGKFEPSVSSAPPSLLALSPLRGRDFTFRHKELHGQGRTSRDARAGGRTAPQRDV